MTTTRTPHLIDRAHAESVLWRVAVAAFFAYPGREQDEPGYTVDEDIAWCLIPLKDLAAEQFLTILDLIRAQLTEPCPDRRLFLQRIAAITEHDEDVAAFL